MFAFIAFVMSCLRGFGLFVGTLIGVIVTTMAGIKNVAALKFYPAASLVVIAKPQVHGDGVLLGRP